MVLNLDPNESEEEGDLDENEDRVREEGTKKEEKTIKKQS